MEEINYWIWLSRIEKLGSRKTQKLLQKYGHPKGIWQGKKEELVQIEAIGEKLANEIINPKYREGLDYFRKQMEKEKIELITLQDKEYPNQLKELYDKPISFYIKGNKEILKQFSLAVIGCRENSHYGKQVTEAITRGLVKQNINTISGLAIGIDSICHQVTIQEKGKTIAVIGSGLDCMYPYQNKVLAEQIIKTGGCILSEYPLGTRPNKINFPARNRIISALSSGVIVVEAKQKSGTMITVDFALEQGKNVFAIPGNITSQNAEGTNELIKQGAKCVTCIQDILEEYIAQRK